jgi:hypothetical protein
MLGLRATQKEYSEVGTNRDGVGAICLAVATAYLFELRYWGVQVGYTGEFL